MWLNIYNKNIYVNYMNYKQYEPLTHIYNVECFNDMGHFNFTIDNKYNNNIINKYIYDHIYKNYVESYYIKHNNLVVTHYKLKDNLNKKWAYKFLYENDVYIINVIFNLH